VVGYTIKEYEEPTRLRIFGTVEVSLKTLFDSSHCPRFHYRFCCNWVKIFVSFKVDIGVLHQSNHNFPQYPFLLEILERFQSKVLRVNVETPWYVPNVDTPWYVPNVDTPWYVPNVDTPWYVPNTVIRKDLQTPTVKEEIRHYSSQYSARLSVRPNGLIVNIMAQTDIHSQKPQQVSYSLSFTEERY
jgi:hypothetical protein